MEPNAVAGMVFTLLLALLIGGFILLYPLTRRLGALLEARLQEKRTPAPRPASGEIEALRDAVAQLGTDVQSLLDRQDFIEKLLSQRMDPRPLAAPSEIPPRAIGGESAAARPPGRQEPR